MCEFGPRLLDLHNFAAFLGYSFRADALLSLAWYHHQPSIGPPTPNLVLLDFTDVRNFQVEQAPDWDVRCSDDTHGWDYWPDDEGRAALTFDVADSEWSLQTFTAHSDSCGVPALYLTRRPARWRSGAAASGAVSGRDALSPRGQKQRHDGAEGCADDSCHPREAGGDHGLSAAWWVRVLDLGTASDQTEREQEPQQPAGAARQGQSTADAHGSELREGVSERKPGSPRARRD
jgi:hypothetical protein